MVGHPAEFHQPSIMPFSLDAFQLGVVIDFSSSSFKKTEFSRGEWLLLLERSPAGSGDVAQVCRPRHARHHFGDGRRIQFGNGPIRLGSQGSPSSIRLYHRPRRYVKRLNFILHRFSSGIQDKKERKTRFGYRSVAWPRVRFSRDDDDFVSYYIQ